MHKLTESEMSIVMSVVQRREMVQEEFARAMKQIDESMEDLMSMLTSRYKLKYDNPQFSGDSNGVYIIDKKEDDAVDAEQ